jgi:hypothetical protein
MSAPEYAGLCWGMYPKGWSEKQDSAGTVPDCAGVSTQNGGCKDRMPPDCAGLCRGMYPKWWSQRQDSAGLCRTVPGYVPKMVVTKTGFRRTVPD